MQEMLTVVCDNCEARQQVAPMAADPECEGCGTKLLTPSTLRY